MRKLISASKRKWVLGGILGFAAVALTTTGFATWIVGVNATTGTDDVTVTVDTVQNKGVKLTFELTEDKLVLGETEEKNSGVVQTGEEVTGDMKVTAKITLEVGAQYLEENEITGIELSLDYGTSEKPTNRQNLVTLNKIGRGTSGNESQVSVDSGSYWEYINAPGKIVLDETTIKGQGATNGLYTYTVTQDLTFKWGSYFGQATSPAEYYNNKYPSVETVSVTDVNNIYAELEKMKTAFTKVAEDTNNIITLTAKLA